MTPVEADPYNKMLSKSLYNNVSVLDQDDPFKRTSLRKGSNDGQLWQILDGLKVKKGE